MKTVVLTGRWLLLRQFLLMIVISTFYCNVSATSLPTSKEDSLGDWTEMHIDSFAETESSAKEQCERNASISESDALTNKKCALLYKKLVSKSCLIVWVSNEDDVVFDYLNGFSNGEFATLLLYKKQTGRRDRSLLCDLGDGLYSYWFTGVKNQSCNNLAFVLPRKIKVVHSVLSDGYGDPKIIYFSDPVQQYEPLIYPGLPILGLPHSVFVGGAVAPDYDDLKSNGYYYE